jgi:hypothetical protein
LLLLLGVAHADPPDVAVVSDLRGQVERRVEAEAPWNAIGLDEAVRLRDEVRTGDQSLAELRFVDGTVLALGEKTRLRISLALFDPDQAPPEIRVALAGEADVRVGTAPLLVETADGARRFEPGTVVRLRDGPGGLDVLPGEPAVPPSGSILAPGRAAAGVIAPDAVRGDVAPSETAPPSSPPPAGRTGIRVHVRVRP